MQTIEWIEHDRKKKQVLNIIWHINREGTFTYNNEFDYRIKLIKLIKQDNSKSIKHTLEKLHQGLYKVSLYIH